MGIREFSKNNGFDLKEAVKAVDAYSNSTGVGCMIIGLKGQTLYEKHGESDSCNFCRNIKKILGGHQNCENAHLYGSYQAERFGGKYIFFCPMGLVHWASPINIKGIMKGSLLGGPVQMIEPEEFLIEDILKKNGIKKEHIRLVKDSINNIKVVKTEIVNSLSDTLFMVSSFLSDANFSKYAQKQEYHELHANISEYIHNIKSGDGASNKINSYPIEKERELLRLISIGDKSGSQKILNEIFGHIFFTAGGEFEIIKARILELIVLLSRAALEGGADVEQIFGLNFKYLNEIHDFHTVLDLTYWLSKIMMRFTDYVFNLAGVKHVDIIYRAIDYIKKNYMKKITLEDVASNVYLSPAYFSKVFKRETNITFNNYLNRIRIEMSKSLLSDDSIPLAEVSYLVGYEEQSYFSKVFKKIEGVAPGSYRKARGRTTK
jgi:two-component system response regulator YesN